MTLGAILAETDKTLDLTNEA
ncbi:protein of unknown function [Ruminococcaceae bacterium BL-6]|nr:protein of unknown function [Ruminococcaceae bacterium BL-6]